jgi:hypothetical protein
MDLGFVAEFYMPIVLVACLIVGYCIKHITWLDRISNEYIPTIMAILGAIVGCAANGLTLDNVIAGAFSGLASTGLHQAFTQIINKNK